MISAGPEGQSVETTVFPNDRASTITSPKPSEFEDSTSKSDSSIKLSGLEI